MARPAITCRMYTGYFVEGIKLEFINEGLPMINGRQVEYVDEKQTISQNQRLLNNWLCALLWMIPVVCVFFFPHVLDLSDHPFLFLLYLIVFKYFSLHDPYVK